MTRPPTLTTKVASGLKYSTVQFAVSFGQRLISVVVLSRLLSPEIYGVFAVVMVVQYVLEMVSDMGLRSVVLTREGEVEDTLLHTCFTFSVLRGLVIGTISILITLGIAYGQSGSAFSSDSAYSAPVLPWAIAALGGVAFLNGFVSMNPYMAERRMEFRAVTFSLISSNLLGLISTIAFAYFYQSVWALVLGALVQRSTGVVLSHLVFPGPRARFSLDRKSRAIVIDRGKWLIGHSILTATVQSADRLILSAFMTSASFGLYFIARQIIGFSIGFLQTVDSRMGLQVFREILGGSPEDIQRRYYRYRLIFDPLAGIGAGVLVVLSPLLVDIVLDDRYAGVGSIMQILAVGLLPHAVLTLRAALSAERKFRLMTWHSLVSTITLWAGLGVAGGAFQSEVAMIFVIALYRIPEAALLLAYGGARGWINPLREALLIVLFAGGLGLGWAIESLWTIVT